MDIMIGILRSLVRCTLTIAVAAVFFSSVVACGWYDGLDGDVTEGEMTQVGVLRLHFSVDATKNAGEVLPLPGDFILSVQDNLGNPIYKGKFCDSPEEMHLKAGSYLISIKSREFDKPAFAAPVYGDEQCVMVVAGSVLDVNLNCTMQNCGIKLEINDSFLYECPDAVIFVSDGHNRLLYAYREKRIAYFEPGTISVIMSSEGQDKVLAVRNIGKKEVLVLSVGAAGTGESASKNGMTAKVDTSRIWTYDGIIIGSEGSSPDTGSGDSGDTGQSTPYDVEKAKECIGAKDVWVCGYIVGGDLSTSVNGIAFAPPFTSSTHLAIASRTKVSKKSSCLSVQLSKPMRDDLSLVGRPGNLGKMVLLKGDIVQVYYGIPGIKNITEYEFQPE